MNKTSSFEGEHGCSEEAVDELQTRIEQRLRKKRKKQAQKNWARVLEHPDPRRRKIDETTRLAVAALKHDSDSDFMSDKEDKMSRTTLVQTAKIQKAHGNKSNKNKQLDTGTMSSREAVDFLDKLFNVKPVEGKHVKCAPGLSYKDWKKYYGNSNKR